MKVGDVVILKDQSTMLIDKTLAGGVIMLIDDAAVVLSRHGRPLTVHNIEELRPLEASDLVERGIEIR